MTGIVPQGAQVPHSMVNLIRTRYLPMYMGRYSCLPKDGFNLLCKISGKMRLPRYYIHRSLAKGLELGSEISKQKSGPVPSPHRRVRLEFLYSVALVSAFLQLVSLSYF